MNLISSITCIFLFIMLINGIFAIRFIQDLLINWQELKNEPAPGLHLIITLPIIFFFSALGISDFATSSLLYRKMKWVGDKHLPGTLNTQCVIPVAVMALAFISVIQVDLLTLFVCIISQMLGGYCGPKVMRHFSLQSIRVFIGVGLVVSSIFILGGKFNLMPSGGIATGLSYGKLIIASVCLAFYGALNSVGIGSYAPTMITVYALGLNPVIAFPIMMGASAFSVPVCSLQFIKIGNYSRKITLFSSSIGLIGTLIGVRFVGQLDVGLLQWFLAGILLYSGLELINKELKSRQCEEIQNASA